MTSTVDGRALTESYTSGIFSGMGSTVGYDALGRRSSHSTVVGSGTLATSYGYDGASRLKTVTSGSDVAVYSYASNASRVSGIVQHQGSGTILGTVKDYDTLGRLEEISATAGANVVSSHSYTYNDLNQRTEAVLQDGSKWSYGYDSLGQVTSAGRTWADTTAVAGQQYAYDFDTIGNRESTTVNGRTAEYAANNLNQYTSREVPGVIDMMGSATSTAVVTVNSQTTSRKGDYFYTSLNIENEEAAQYPEVVVKAVLANSGTNGEDLVSLETGNVFVAKTPESYTYDDDGNVLTDGRWQYTWDGENRLIAMESGTSAPAGSKKKLVFGYDGQSRRVSKNVYTWSGSYSLSAARRFVYDGWNLVAELDGSSEVLQRYVWGADLSGSLQGAGGVGGLLTLMNSEGSYYPTYDGNGNVMSLLKSSDQAVVARYHYGAFGESIQVSGGMENPFRFSTKYNDTESALMYYGHRFYDPEIGRWNSRDSINEFGGVNLFAFLNNDTLTAFDANGLQKVEPFEVQLRAALKGKSPNEALALFNMLRNNMLHLSPEQRYNFVKGNAGFRFDIQRRLVENYIGIGARVDPFTMSSTDVRDSGVFFSLKNSPRFVADISSASPGLIWGAYDVKAAAATTATLGQFIAKVTVVACKSPGGGWIASGKFSVSDTYDFNYDPVQGAKALADFQAGNDFTYYPKDGYEGRSLGGEIKTMIMSVVPGTPFQVNSVEIGFTQSSADGNVSIKY